jgi:predicted P-loop ATPase
VIVKTYGNTVAILRHGCAGRLRTNRLTLCPELDGRALEEADFGALREELERRWCYRPGAEDLRMAVAQVARDAAYHPVQEHLLALAWDGEGRLGRVAAEILGASAPLAAQLVRAWIVSAVARALTQGCKADSALVLVGPQGAGKSTFFQVLGGAWFTDTHIDLTSKDAYGQVAGAWVIEWAEMERVTARKGSDVVKGFLSSARDFYRPPYERAPRWVPRGSVVCGSTNQRELLDDETGSRRFWMVDVGRVDVDRWRGWRDQVLAEAVSAWQSGEAWHLDGPQEGERAAQAEQYRVEDPWEGSVTRWLGAQGGADYTAEEILSGALDVPRKDQDRRATGLHGVGSDRGSCTTKRTIRRRLEMRERLRKQRLYPPRAGGQARRERHGNAVNAALYPRSLLLARVRVGPLYTPSSSFPPVRGRREQREQRVQPLFLGRTLLVPSSAPGRLEEGTTPVSATVAVDGPRP